MSKRQRKDPTRKFLPFPGIYISPSRCNGNPTIGKTDIIVWRAWKADHEQSLDQLIDDHEDLSEAQVTEALYFTDWCLELGLMVERQGELFYDKDALYKAAMVEEPPSGTLCLFCGGFITHRAPDFYEVKLKEPKAHQPISGGTHINCLEAALNQAKVAQANVFLGSDEEFLLD